MSAQPNTLLLDARARDDRTVLSRVRADGLWRTSRAFRAGAATRVVVSQLGPGMIRGDVFTSIGTVGPGASLIVCGQMATRILPGPREIAAHASWTVEPGGLLDIVAEPVIVTVGAAYRARLTIRLAEGARARVSDIVCCEATGSAWTMLRVDRSDRAAAIDALRIADAGIGIGTLAVFGPCDREALDRAAPQCDGVRVGIGTLRDGDTLVRVTGAVGAVRSALERLRERLD